MARVSQAAPRAGQAELDAAAGADRDRSTLTVTLHGVRTIIPRVTRAAWPLCSTISAFARPPCS